MIPGLLKKVYISPFLFLAKLAFFLLLAVLVIGAVVVSRIDLNDYKPRVERELTVLFDAAFKIHGDIAAGIQGIRPSLVLNDVTLGDDYKAAKVKVTFFQQLISKSNEVQLHLTLEDLYAFGRLAGDYKSVLQVSLDGFALNDIKGKLGKGRIEGAIVYRHDKLLIDMTGEKIDYGAVIDGMRGGNVDINVDLESSGADTAALVRNLNGKLYVGGQAGRLAGNAIDFWVGGLMTSVLSGAQAETQINCAIAGFDVKGGVAQSTGTIIDTMRVTIYGRGHVDFNEENVDFIFEPQPKTPSLTSIATPVVVRGRFGRITATPEQGALLRKLGGLALGIVNPAMVLLPMMDAGTGKDNPCLKYVNKKL